MSEMVERVAAALLAAFEEHNNMGGCVCDEELPPDGEVTCLDGHWDLRAIARDVIEAMRDPTKLMMIGDLHVDGRLATSWPLMIDEAKK